MVSAASHSVSVAAGGHCTLHLRCSDLLAHCHWGKAPEAHDDIWTFEGRHLRVLGTAKSASLGPIWGYLGTKSTGLAGSLRSLTRTRSAPQGRFFSLEKMKSPPLLQHDMHREEAGSFYLRQ